MESLSQPEAPPELIRLSRDLYPEGTLGNLHFPEVLEGRTRPADFANIPLQLGPRTINFMNDQGVSSLSDLLVWPADKLNTLPKQHQGWVKRGFARQLENLVENLAVTPHGHFVGWVTGELQGPVAVGDEPVLQQSVEAVVSNFSEHTQTVLRRGFGLDNWSPKNPSAVGRELGISGVRVRRIESHALTQLRISMMDPHAGIKRFSALPLGAIGRRLGYVYRRDLPARFIPFQTEQLSAVARDELTNYPDTYRFLMHDPPQVNYVSQDKDVYRLLNLRVDPSLSPATLEEIDMVLRRTLRSHAQQTIFGDLLPEVSAPNNPADVTGNTPISVLPFSNINIARLHEAGYTTLASLIRLETTTQKLGRQRKEVIQEVGVQTRKLADYLLAITDTLRPPEQ